MDKATFAAGCFWHVQKEFDKLTDIKTKVGYAGGHTVNPTYDEVSTGTTSHAEAVQIVFGDKISFENLLDTFWKIHDPTQSDGQGADIGNQYRSIIFYQDSNQRAIAERSKKEIQKKFKLPIVTEIKPIDVFYKAEEYHQKYLQKRGKANC